MQHRLTKSGRIDGRIFNGGARKGAGRPLSPQRQLWLNFALEKVIVKEFRHGQIRRVKKTRLEAVMDTLFKIGMTGEGRKSVSALSELMDRAIGKPERQRVPRNARALRRDRYYSPKFFDDLGLEELIESIYEANEQIAEGRFFPEPPKQEQRIPRGAD